MRDEIRILLPYHVANLAHHRVELLRASSRLGVVDNPLERELAVDIYGVHALVAELLGKAVRDLIDLIARQRVLSGDIVGVLLPNPLAPDVGFNGNLRRMKPLQYVDELCDFLLALRRQYIVGLHVEDVMSRIGHVVDAEHQN
ncbi:MAG: hypothetical protein DMF58_04655, partial [Acidobacteria bacterium]